MSHGEPEIPRPKPSSRESIALQAVEQEQVAFVFFRRPAEFDTESDATLDEWGGSTFEIVRLDREKVDIGRHPDCEVALSWDMSVSRAHAELVEVGARWRVEDVGSQNGTLVNGVRVREQLLSSGDLLRFGDTFVVFRQPEEPGLGETLKRIEEGPMVSEAQRRVLVELVRPMLATNGEGDPATNSEIAGALHLSEETVKQHLRRLYQLFGIGEDTPRSKKRAILARKAHGTGVVSVNDLA